MKMRAHFLILSLAIFAIRAIAAAEIPPELVGEWRSANGFLILRADGFAVMVGDAIGFPCLATYDPKTLTLTLSPRISAGDMPKGAKQPPDIKLSYDANALKISSTDGIGPYKRHSEELAEPYKSFDLKKLPEPRK